MEKDPQNYSFLNYLWVIALAMWGGVASYVSKVKDGKLHKFSIMEFVGELVVSGFIGVITFWFCEWREIHPLLSAAFIGISGHMGSRAIFLAEAYIKNKFPGAMNKDEK